jgi:HEPN domain-containing protein
MWPTPYEMVCFHCQQAVEKYLKWFLVLHDIDPPKIHNLIELEKLCEVIDHQFSMLYEKCGILTGYGVISRYPSDMKIGKIEAKSLGYGGISLISRMSGISRQTLTEGVKGLNDPQDISAPS